MGATDRLDWNGKWLLGNWKMHGSRKSLDDFFGAFDAFRDAARSGETKPAGTPGLCAGLAVPHVYLEAASRALKDRGGEFVFPVAPEDSQSAAGQDADRPVYARTAVVPGAQDASHFPGRGAYTGEVSTAMLKDAGCGFVLVGHSERRTYYHEDNDMLVLKMENALADGLVPVYCIGEDLNQRKANRAQKVVDDQLSVLAKLTINRVAIAYEPVWAIGTGVTASLDEIAEIHAFIRRRTREILDDDVPVRVMYGGSVKPDNVESILKVEGVDGALVGGASLLAKDFTALLAISGASPAI